MLLTVIAAACHIGRSEMRCKTPSFDRLKLLPEKNPRTAAESINALVTVYVLIFGIEASDEIQCVAISRSICVQYPGGAKRERERKKRNGVQKREKKKEQPRSELITHFRLLKSERGLGRMGTADRCQYRFICVRRGGGDRARGEAKVCSELPE